MIRYIEKEAVRLHRILPEEEWIALREYGVPAIVVHGHLLGWDGKHITIPVFSYDRHIISFEHGVWNERDHLEMVPRKGQRVALYGAHLLRSAPTQVIITEGIGESLVLAGQSFTAVSATGSGRDFKEEWVPLFRCAREVFVCFKRGPESDEAAERIAFMVPGALVVHLPEEVGEGGGVADFFGRLERSRREFLGLLSFA